MKSTELIGLGLIFLAMWFYCFGFSFVQALDCSIPDIELNGIRLLGVYVIMVIHVIGEKWKAC